MPGDKSLVGYELWGTRVHSRVKQPSFVPGDARTLTLTRGYKTSKDVFSRVRTLVVPGYIPEDTSLVGYELWGCVPEYDQNNQVSYPGALLIEYVPY